MFYSVGYFIGIVSLLSMAAFVGWAQPRRPEARLWSILSFLVAVWFFGRFMILHSDTAAQAFFWQRIMYLGAIYLNIVYYQFVSAFIGRDKNRWFLYLGYGIATFLTAVNFSSHLFVKTMLVGSVFHFYEQVGPLYPLHAIVYCLYPGLGFLRLLRERSRVNSVRRNQMDYILVASAIGFICGATTFPLIFGIKMPPIGGPFVPVYSFIVAYAIVKHQLLDIRIVVRKTLVYSAATLSLTVVYVAVLVAITKTIEGWGGAPHVYSSAIAAAVIAILFQPVRLRIQQWMDRHFPRESLNQNILREATGRFVHEIKRPLANISMPAQLVLMDLEAAAQRPENFGLLLPKLRERMNYIVNESLKAGQKIEAIQHVSSQTSVQREPVDLGKLLEDLLAQERPRLERENITLTVSGVSAGQWTKGDSAQLEIALLNLLKNAIDALSQVGQGNPRHLRVSLDRGTEGLIIDVEDSGAGISPADLPHLFDPWFTTKGSGGMGIGLYLTREIIRLHSARMDVKSQPGSTLFRLIFQSTPTMNL